MLELYSTLSYSFLGAFSNQTQNYDLSMVCDWMLKSSLFACTWMIFFFFCTPVNVFYLGPHRLLVLISL
uniref:Uncharacterized protein n=1 Tax=Rhizophora mucronata TaxID=61149 RepID=A0A2P2M0X0_RHIMU